MRISFDYVHDDLHARKHNLPSAKAASDAYFYRFLLRDFEFQLIELTEETRELEGVETDFSYYHYITPQHKIDELVDCELADSSFFSDEKQIRKYADRRIKNAVFIGAYKTDGFLDYYFLNELQTLPIFADERQAQHYCIISNYLVYFAPDIMRLNQTPCEIGAAIGIIIDYLMAWKEGEARHNKNRLEDLFQQREWLHFTNDEHFGSVLV